ncbi:MAG: Rieske 2Fe-2S domain-containing protein [Stellaceae bacterium]
MLLRNAWYIAAWADEVAGERPLARRICNEPIVLFRDRAGCVGALADRCCHRAAPLNMGTVVEGGIQCGYHGLVIEWVRALCAYPRAAADPRGGPGPQLPRGRKRPAGVGLDG